MTNESKWIISKQIKGCFTQKMLQDYIQRFVDSVIVFHDKIRKAKRFTLSYIFLKPNKYAQVTKIYEYEVKMILSFDAN